MRKLIFRLSVPVLLLAGLGLVWLDAQVQERFQGQRWQLPARIYARPLELYSGATLRRSWLLRELQALGYRQAAGADSPGTYQVTGKRMSLYTRGFDFGPEREVPQRITLVWGDDQGVQLEGEPSLLRLEPLTVGHIYPAHGEDRTLVQFKDVPPLMLQGLMAIEDREYYDHYGLSWRGILRAAIANLRAGRVVQGGSTLTQQLVKNLYLDSEQTLWRKFVEALMAVLLELRYDKNEILETYINAVFFAQRGSRAVHGFALASQYFIGLNLDQLEPDHMAMLVGMVKAPSTYNPYRNPEVALVRRNLVLDVWRDLDIIDAEQHTLYTQRPLQLASAERAGSLNFPGWRALVYRQLQRDYSKTELSEDGLRIFTSLDPQIQWQAERSLTTTIEHLEKGYPRADKLQGAVVVVSPESGEITALVSDRNPKYAGFNRALDARRQIGSLVKPVVYLTALEQGYRLGDVLLDEPLSLTLDDGSVWRPRNFKEEYSGQVLMYEGLYKSINLPSLRLALDLKINNIVQRLQNLGVPADEIPRVPSLALGAIALSPLQVAQLYETIASGGFYVPLRAILSVVDPRGKVLQRNPLQNRQVAEPAPMHLLQWNMLQVANRGTAQGLNLPVDSIISKTGTTNDFRDSWFVGISGDHIGVVWVGRDDNQSTSLSGATGALQVWNHLFQRLGIRPARLVFGEDIEFVWVNRTDGLLSNKKCTDAIALPQRRVTGRRIKRTKASCK